jgi:hypothetical protein
VLAPSCIHRSSRIACGNVLVAELSFQLPAIEALGWGFLILRTKGFFSPSSSRFFTTSELNSLTLEEATETPVDCQYQRRARGPCVLPLRAPFPAMMATTARYPGCGGGSGAYSKARDKRARKSVVNQMSWMVDLSYGDDEPGRWRPIECQEPRHVHAKQFKFLSI